MSNNNKLNKKLKNLRKWHKIFISITHISKCIIIPVFNEYENINILLDEIYKNDFKDLIIIIVDDLMKILKIYIQKGRQNNLFI